MDKKELKWLDVWKQNYSWESPEAKWLEQTSKLTYKGDVYVPWGNILHALYMQDEDAVVEKVKNNTGGFVHTDEQYITSIKEGVETTNVIKSHMVIVRVTFMGKTFEDVYPVQDKDYGASKAFDQNLINKALQRNLARVISLATGLCWSYYENGELQFEDDEDKKKKTSKATVTSAPKPKETPKPKKPEAPKVEKSKGSEGSTDGDTDARAELAQFLVKNKDNVRVVGTLEKYNQVLSTKYSVTLDLEKDDEKALIEKLKVVSNPSTMLNGLKKVTNND